MAGITPTCVGKAFNPISPIYQCNLKIIGAKLTVFAPIIHLLHRKNEKARVDYARAFLRLFSRSHRRLIQRLEKW